MKKYAISDIHGYNETFNALLKAINLQPNDELYLLGDYIDRGPNSKGVIDTIFQLREKGHQVICLKGNHEAALLESKSDWRMENSWRQWGGLDTLASFDSLITDNIPTKYWQFMDALPLYYEVDDYILVHAGINFAEKDPFSDKKALLWIRNWYRGINYRWLAGRKIIHGHTPKPKGKIIEMHQKFPLSAYLNIDAGCYCYGWLCAYNMTDNTLIFQERVES